MAKFKKIKFNDLGLGTKATSGGYRALNKDGTFNVEKKNVPILERINFFHALISMSWLKFIGLILLGYMIVNVFFGIIYMLIGVENITGIQASSPLEEFIEMFFFSSQTVTTLGYGRVAPIGLLANVVASIESMLGLLGFALATGLLYGRFSKPKPKIKYSSYAVMAPYHDINGLMFRVLNPHKNQLIEVEVTVTLSIKRNDSELRDFHLLELERSKVVFFPSVWTIVHPVGEKSPIYNLSLKEFDEREVEFIVMIKAFDESFSQTVYSRSSYKSNELKWGEKFTYIINHEENGISVDVSRINETQKATLNNG